MVRKKSKSKIGKYFFSVSIGLIGIIVVFMFASLIMRIFVYKPIDPSFTDISQGREKKEIIQINILNACGKPGIAREAKIFMRKRGFDVVEVGNYDSIVTYSCIFDRVGDINSSLKVAKAIGIADTLVFTNIDSMLFLRSSVIIGEDFLELKPFQR